MFSGRLYQKKHKGIRKRMQPDLLNEVAQPHGQQLLTHLKTQYAVTEV